MATYGVLVDQEDGSSPNGAADGRRRFGRSLPEAPRHCGLGASVTAAGLPNLAVDGEGGHAGELAAVDGEDGSGDEGGRIGAQPQRCGGDVVHGTDPAQ